MPPTLELVHALRARRTRRLARASLAGSLPRGVAVALVARVKLLRRRKGRPIRLGRRPHPHATELDYRRALLAYLDGIQALIWRGIAPLLRELPEGRRTDGTRTDALEPADLFGHLREQIRRRGQEKAPGIAARVVKRTGDANLTSMNAQFATLLGPGFGIFQGVSPRAREVLDGAIRANVDLIESLGDHLLDQAETEVRQGILEGLHAGDLADRIRERFSVSDSRAELIARDQVGKLDGALVQARAADLGIDEYEWSGSDDGREREDHLVLNGTLQRFSDPPVVDERTGRRENPGGDYQCRCQALPRAEGILDALGVD